MLDALSVGIRDQLATLIRMAIAEELGSAIVPDDHLVHSAVDLARVMRPYAGATQAVPESNVEPVERARAS